jgi:tetratricopeptide (TPR) repeat protein
MTQLVYYDTIGKFEDSVEYYEQYVAKRPDDKQTVQRMCEILIRLGNQTANHDERGIRLAFRRYDRVLDLQPDNLEARFARLRLNMRSQNWVAAKQDVGVILRIYPDDSDALRMFEEIKCRDN